MTEVQKLQAVMTERQRRLMLLHRLKERLNLSCQEGHDPGGDALLTHIMRTFKKGPLFKDIATNTGCIVDLEEAVSSSLCPTSRTSETTLHSWISGTISVTSQADKSVCRRCNSLAHSHGFPSQS